MEFITLREVFYAIKARVSAPTGSGEFADEIIISEAAGLLHQALSNNSKSRPHWVEENKISGKPIFNDTAVHPEAMAMLEHASGYHDRSVKNRSNHNSSCLKAGLDPNEVGDVIHLADLPFSELQFIFRLREIGFDRAELVEFLDKKIDHDLTLRSTTSNPTLELPAPPVKADSTLGRVEMKKAGPTPIDTDKAEEEKPWLIANSNDPTPEQFWYTPARYFARQLVQEDSTLLRKKSVLAEKVSKTLADTGFKKRGGKLKLSSGTVLKAFSNIHWG